jgi:hypothetical protein
LEVYSVKNPFEKVDPPVEGEEVDRDAQLEAALADEPVEGEEEVADPEVEVVEPDEVDKTLLFDDDDASDGEEEEVADPEAAGEETLFETLDKNKGEIPKGWTKGTYKRFQQVIGQRNEERQHSKQLAAALETAKALAGVFSDRYSDFANPAGMAAFDADFMQGLEELCTSGRTDIAEMAEAVKEYVKTGKAPEMSSTSKASIVTQPNASADAPAADPRIDALLAREARGVISATLSGAGVKPAFQSLISEHIVATEGEGLHRR